MWGDVVVSNMDQAALLATQIRRASLALPSYEKAEVVGDEMLQGEAGQEVSVSMVKAEAMLKAEAGRDALKLLSLLDAAYAHLFTMDAAGTCQVSL